MKTRGGDGLQLAEQKMYPVIQDYLEQNGCERVLIEKVTFDYIKRWTIDVAGIKEARVYAVEAKPHLTFDSFSAALTQARYYKQACTHVYVCLSEASNKKEEELLRHIEEICEQEGVGLLLLTPQLKIQKLKEAKETKPDLDKYFPVMQQLTVERPSDKIQGARVFILRDLCYYLAGSPFKGEALEKDLRKHFFSRNPASSAYWRKAYINPRTKAERTLDATTIAAEDLGLIERVERQDEKCLRLTCLGRDLVNVIDVSEAGKTELSEQVKAFFHALSQRYLEVRTAVHTLKEFGGRILYGKNECNKGHRFWADKAFIEEGKILCPKCREELSPKSEKTSLLSRLVLKLRYDPYPQLVFWINSRVLPIRSYSRNKILEYVPTQK